MTASTAPKRTEHPDIESARRVLAAESGALNALAAGLGDDFIAALDVLEAAPGRVIVTGMGKSGHIARKIAATLASTGAPAFFVHPAEASHGDLGMLTAEDVLLALSNSGETAELADMVAYAARFEIPVVAITAKADSALAKAARAALVYPAETEACPMGLAPTTSTAMQLGLGDALAVALLERRAFSADDFQVLHPGGQLGRRLLKVSDLMHTGPSVPVVGPEQPMSEALVEMTAKGFGCVGVTDAQGLLMGVITDGDLRRRMSPGLLDARADEIMTADPIVAAPDMLASEALRIMNANAVTNLFVAAARKPAGVLHVHDCLRAGVA